MLLTLRFSGSELNFFGGSKEGERLEEFWFGRGFAWGNSNREVGRSDARSCWTFQNSFRGRNAVIGKSGLRLDFAILGLLRVGTHGPVSRWTQAARIRA